MSADPMEDDRRCRATSRQTGRRCRRFPVPGATVCAMHGGAAPAVRAAAERRRAEAEATALYEEVWNPNAEPVTNVVDELHRMAGQLKHSVNVLGALVATDGLDSVKAIAFDRLVGHLRRLLADIARLGIDDKKVELDAARAEMVTVAFLTAIDLLQLPPADRTSVVRTFLERLDGGSQPGQTVAGEAEG